MLPAADVVNTEMITEQQFGAGEPDPVQLTGTVSVCAELGQKP